MAHHSTALAKTHCLCLCLPPCSKAPASHPPKSLQPPLDWPNLARKLGNTFLRGRRSRHPTVLMVHLSCFSGVVCRQPLCSPVNCSCTSSLPRISGITGLRCRHAFNLAQNVPLSLLSWHFKIRHQPLSMSPPLNATECFLGDTIRELVEDFTYCWNSSPAQQTSQFKLDGIMSDPKSVPSHDSIHHLITPLVYSPPSWYLGANSDFAGRAWQAEHCSPGLAELLWCWVQAGRGARLPSVCPCLASSRLL